MGQRQDITEYIKGETIVIGALLRTREGAALDPTPLTLTFIVSEPKTEKKLVVVPAADIDIVNAPTGEVTITIPVAAQRNLAAGTVYRYDFWSTSNSNEVLHQATGQFVLQRAVGP